MTVVFGCFESSVQNTPVIQLLAVRLLGCSPDSLRAWCQQAERDTGKREGLTTAEKDRIRDLERENKELR